MMCAVNAYVVEHSSGPGNESSGGDRTLTMEYSKEWLESIGKTINFTDNWIQFFEGNHYKIIILCKQNMINLFNKTPLLIPSRNLDDYKNHKKNIN